MVQVESLAHCPFCGGTARVLTLWVNMQNGITALDGGTPAVCVKCNGCGARTATHEKQVAVRQWNQRQPGLVGEEKA